MILLTTANLVLRFLDFYVLGFIASKNKSRKKTYCGLLWLYWVLYGAMHLMGMVLVKASIFPVYLHCFLLKSM